ncbi:hypothetical protein HanRHA438_Chr01g0008811 [Helianthus annuus]|nr:hypothetical protein HanRHA438_Chr01g0008811 [Helianthus annuus]
MIERQQRQQSGHVDPFNVRQLNPHTEALTIVAEGTRRIFLVVDSRPKAHQPISYLTTPAINRSHHLLV